MMLIGKCTRDDAISIVFISYYLKVPELLHTFREGTGISNGIIKNPYWETLIPISNSISEEQ
jgi:hypothetical protein